MSDRIEVLGVSFDDLTMDEAVARGLELMAERRAAYVVTPNPEIVMLCRANPEAADAVAGAALTIPDGIGVIDVGTDHAYLPVALARRGYCGNLLASDIGEGPLAVARRHAEDASVADRIRFFCCDGLELCPPEDVDCIVIAGRGGDTPR